VHRLPPPSRRFEWKPIVDAGINALDVIGKSRKIAFLFHGDHDGCSAAAILSMYLDEFYGKKPEHLVSLIRSPYTITRTLMDQFKLLAPEVVIILDLPVARDQESLLQLQETVKARLVIFDHHKTDSLKAPDTCVLLNPRFVEKELVNAPPPCYFAHLMYKAMNGKHDICWIAGIGVVGDVCVEVCQDLMEEVRQHHPDLYGFAEIRQDMAWGSKLGELTRLVNTGRFYGEEGPLVALRALLAAGEAEDPNLLFGQHPLAKKLRAFRLRVDESVSTEMQKAQRSRRVFEDAQLSVYEISSEMNVENAVISGLRALDHDHAIVLLSHKGATVSFELRRGSKSVDLVDSIAFALRGLRNASGGGHPAAGGGTLLARDVPVFLERLRVYLTKRHQEEQ
jgi:nanoRNase/pAp phosphatase (c-di-AMP/oligoRNAs hydrolase)